MHSFTTTVRAILASFSPRAAAERARAAALLLFWNHIAQSLAELDHLFTLWRTNTLPGAGALRASSECEPAPNPHQPPNPRPSTSPAATPGASANCARKPAAPPANAKTSSPPPRNQSPSSTRSAACSASPSPVFPVDPSPDHPVDPSPDHPVDRSPNAPRSPYQPCAPPDHAIFSVA